MGTWTLWDYESVSVILSSWGNDYIYIFISIYKCIYIYMYLFDACQECTIWLQSLEFGGSAVRRGLVRFEARCSRTDRLICNPSQASPIGIQSTCGTHLQVGSLEVGTFRTSHITLL